ncbi:putative wsc domain protein [Alternaria alternata]|nr:putative wsc domain protein [Alternaria alternata]
MMRTAFPLLLVAFIQRVASSRYPLLQWDPETVEDCIDWYDNGQGKTCEYVRELYGYTAAEFSEWNPSVGLDCKPWDWQSYCVITQRKYDSIHPTTTSSKVITTTTSTSQAPSLGPSPTSWDALGCYAQNPNRPILEKNMNLNGDTSLSVLKCKNSCYRRAYTFAGVQEGNQCWCSSYVAGEWTKNQTDCNIPCTGNKAEFCGGKGVINVFEALQNAAPVITTSVTSASVTSTSVASISVTSTGVKIVAASNSAIKNRAIIGILYRACCL